MAFLSSVFSVLYALIAGKMAYPATRYPLSCGTHNCGRSKANYRAQAVTLCLQRLYASSLARTANASQPNFRDQQCHVEVNVEVNVITTDDNDYVDEAPYKSVISDISSEV